MVSVGKCQQKIDVGNVDQFECRHRLVDLDCAIRSGDGAHEIAQDNSLCSVSIISVARDRQLATFLRRHGFYSLTSTFDRPIQDFDEGSQKSLCFYGIVGHAQFELADLLNGVAAAFLHYCEH